MPSTGSWLAQAKEVVSNGAPKLYATATSNEDFFEPWVYCFENHIIEDLLEKNGLQFKDKYQVDTDGALMFDEGILMSTMRKLTTEPVLMFLLFQVYLALVVGLYAMLN